MATKGYALSEADVQVLRRIVRGNLHLFTNPRGRPDQTQIDLQTPDVHVARIPTAGIPGLTPEAGTGTGFEDTPGSADCEIYRLIGGILEPTLVYKKTVYNLSQAEVPGDSWAVLARDKFGDWYVLAILGGTDPPTFLNCVGCGWLEGEGASTLSVLVDGALTDFFLTSTDGQTWTTTDTLTVEEEYDSGTGTAHCSRTFSVTLTKNAPGPPKLVLTEPGSGGAVLTGMHECCKCASSKWSFNLQKICPHAPRKADSCTNVMTVEVTNLSVIQVPVAGCCLVMPKYLCIEKIAGTSICPADKFVLEYGHTTPGLERLGWRSLDQTCKVGFGCCGSTFGVEPSFSCTGGGSQFFFLEFYTHGFGYYPLVVGSVGTCPTSETDTAWHLDIDIYSDPYALTGYIATYRVKAWTPTGC